MIEDDGTDIGIIYENKCRIANQINFYRKFLVIFKIIKVGKNLYELFHIFYFTQTSNKFYYKKYSGYKKKKRRYNIS